MDEAQNPAPAKRKKSSTAPDKRLQPKLVADAGIDPERLEKIAKIKQALADGTYHVPNEEVARKVIDHMRAPGDKPKR